MIAICLAYIGAYALVGIAVYATGIHRWRKLSDGAWHREQQLSKRNKVRRPYLWE